MDHEPLDAKSEGELIQALESQHHQMEELLEAVDELDDRVAQLEAWVDELKHIGERIAAAAEAQREREQATRDALRHMDDVTYLAESRLAKLLASLHGEPPTGHALQGALARAIHRMKPADMSYPLTREKRRYEILHLTYLVRQNPAEIAEAQAISERQYYRELKAGIQQVANEVLGPQP